MTPIIEVKNLSKKYRIGESQPYLTLRDTIAGIFTNPLGKIKEGLQKDEFWALKDINFSVEPGEVVGIIGRNGAGKSTLLKILSRITPPTTGEIILRGRVGSLLEVGTGFQQELTGRENIFLNGAILGMTQAEIKKKFDEIVDFAEVEKFIDTPVKHYSSGMYMRLAFSIAAHLDPEILIVDEVLAVGDAEFQKKCLGKMDEVSKKQGKTILFVSHNIVAVNQLCSRVIYLDNGRLINDTDKVDNIKNLFQSQNNSSLISTYLNKDIEKNSISHIYSISLVDKRGKEIKSHIERNSQAYISIKIINLKKTEINIGSRIRSETLGTILTTTNYDSIKDRRVNDGIKEKGSHIYKFKIPLEILRTGIYYIDVVISKPNVEIYDEVLGALSISVFDSEDYEDVGGNNRQGSVLVNIPWHYSKG